MRFVDTNVLVYQISAAEPEKSKIADSIIKEDDLALSVQVLQEFYVQATGRHGLAPDEAERNMRSLERFPVLENTTALVHAAIAASLRYRISYWDAAIVEAARALGCDTILSEDLNHGQDYGGVQVINPFRDVQYS